MYTVTVTSDQTGAVIGLSQNNPEYGYIRVEQVVNQITEGGWFKLAKRSALIKGKVDELKQAGFNAGDEIPGRIIVKESLEPFDPTKPERHYKMAGKTGVQCLYGDQPIFRETFFTQDPNAVDEFIPHTNTEEIREAVAAQKELANLSAMDALKTMATTSQQREAVL
jgi:hypothetical protein